MTSGIVVTRFVACFSLLVGIYGDKAYVAHITDDVAGCEDFTNKHLDCSGLTLSDTKTSDGYDACGVTGPIEILAGFNEDAEMNIEIWKTLACDKEIMWNFKANLCESLKNKNSAWYCLIEAMNITSCPIQVGTYIIKDLVISLDFARDLMNHEFCGTYFAVLKVMEGRKTVVCYTCEVSIEEEDEGALKPGIKLAKVN